MTSLIHKLGLSRAVSFHDVFSITDPDLLEFVPRPAYALLFIFPVSDIYEKHRIEEDAKLEEYDGKGPQEEVMWFKQTIGNACGLIALLHAACNGAAREAISSGSDLENLVAEAEPLGREARAELLYNSKALEAAHSTAAAGGDTEAPDADTHVDLHYVAFVKSKEGNLWELDGRRKGPVMLGHLDGEDDDVLSDKALDLGPKAFMAREESAGELRFSLIVLAPSLE
jgi:ubiquitin carboxyl-terminal hydrolase L3